MSTFKKRCAGVALAAALVGAGTTYAATAASYEHAPSTANPMQLAGCVVRFDTLSDTGATVVPRVHQNSAHINVGCPQIQVDWSDDGVGKVGDLIVKVPGGESNVVTMLVDEDETLSGRQIQCGMSGGGTETRVRCFKNGQFIPIYAKNHFYSSTSNLWLFWVRWEN